MKNARLHAVESPDCFTYQLTRNVDQDEIIEILYSSASPRSNSKTS